MNDSERSVYERGLALYDALTMKEKSSIEARAPRYCYATGYLAAASQFDALVARAERGDLWLKEARAFVKAHTMVPCEPHELEAIEDGTDLLARIDAHLGRTA